MSPQGLTVSQFKKLAYSDKYQRPVQQGKGLAPLPQNRCLGTASPWIPTYR